MKKSHPKERTRVMTAGSLRQKQQQTQPWNKPELFSNAQRVYYSGDNHDGDGEGGREGGRCCGERGSGEGGVGPLKL